METEENIKLGIMFAILAAFCNAAMGVFVKLIGDEQNVNTITFARFFCGLIIFLPWFLSEKDLFILHNKMQVILRSITTLGAMFCIFISLKHLSILNVVLLNNTFPLFVPILALIFLKVKTPPSLWIGIAVGFIGIILVLQPHANEFNKMMLVALLSGFFSACAILQIRLLTKNTSPKKILFYLFLTGSIITGIGLFFSFKKPTMYQFILLLLIGISGSISQFCLTHAVKYTYARLVSVIYFTSIIFAGIFDWIIWDKIPNLLEYIGIVTIVLGGIVTILLSAKLPPQHLTQKKLKV